MLTLFDLNQFLSQYLGFNTSNTRSLILHPLPLPLSFSLISPFCGCGYSVDEKPYARWVLNSEILHLYYSIIVLSYGNCYFIPKTKRNTKNFQIPALFRETRRNKLSGNTISRVAFVTEKCLFEDII